PPWPKRFYKSVSVRDERLHFGISLDGRPLRTPLKRQLLLPKRALAEAVAAEWARQGERIDQASMSLTRLANTALDRVETERARVVAEIVRFAGSDLLCYRAEGPEGLVARQTRLWDPILTWLSAGMGVRFNIIEGLIHQPQPAATLAAV